MKSLAYFTFVLATFVACSRPPATGVTEQAQTQQSPQTPASLKAGETVGGTVLEAIDAASYTYVRVKTASGEIWAATGQVKLTVGDRVAVTVEMPASNFHSPSLNRDFPLLYFASRVEREGAAAPVAADAQAPPPAALMSAHQQMTASTPQAVTTKIPPAQGGVTIADVWARRTALAGKTVTVRGKVVKFNGAILDRNWIHIQDGTGDAKDGTNDLTVTSRHAAKVGEIVTATGVVAVNRDIGSGYKYAVIVEQATLVAK